MNCSTLFEFLIIDVKMFRICRYYRPSSTMKNYNTFHILLLNYFIKIPRLFANYYVFL